MRASEAGSVRGSPSVMRPDSAATVHGRRVAAELLGDGEAGLQSVLVEAGAEVGAAEPGVLRRPAATRAAPVRATAAVSKAGWLYSWRWKIFFGSGSRIGFSVTNIGLSAGNALQRFIQ